MKLCKLKLKNLNSFRDEVELDFENPPLDDASLVAITGPTGAGKTTLLDAICVALYGKTPRLNSTGSQHPSHLISHGEKEGFAELHFVANGTRYISEWSAKRNASPKGQLLNADSGELISDKLFAKGKSLGSSENTVSEEITTILGLDFAAFKRSVMLAQGEFAAFLKANREDRRTILEATADIHIYDILRQALNEKINEVSEAYEEVKGKLEQIPESSREQIAEEEKKLAGLIVESEKLGVEDQRIQKQKDHETERKEDFEKLQSSEKSFEELERQQPMIKELESERERAERAHQLRPEKQAYDSAKSDYEKAAEALQQAETELSDAQKQVESAQTDFDKKEDAYLSASTDRERKMEIYAEAKSDVERAAERFAEVNKRAAPLEELNEQIDTSSNQLKERETDQNKLQEEIAEAQTFLDENPLPTDRHQRANKATGLLADIGALQKQQKEKSNTQSEYFLKIDDLNENLKELSEKREKLRSEEETTVNSLKQAETELKTLQNSGTLEEWQNRKQMAIKAQLMAQQYENSSNQLSAKENIIGELQENIIVLNTSLDDLKKKLMAQSQRCEHADAEVEKLEEEREMARLADSTNQLRQQLEQGKPCRVCGATDHPFADKVEVESEELLGSIEKALNDAETKARKAQKQKQNLEQEQVRLQQDKANTIEQLETGLQEIESINTETEDLRVEWQELYKTIDISSDWVKERIKDAEIAIENFNAIRNNHKDSLNAFQLVSQKLETCELNLDRESELLGESQQKLDTVNDYIEDLKSDISAIEKRFWESMPNTFHGITPDEAVQQLGDKIKAVDLRDQELTTKNNQLKVLNTEIQNDQRELQNLQKRQKERENEIELYQNEGETFLDAVREKTDGLETEDQINNAISKLVVELQAKENARDEAEKLLQENRQLFTQKQTAHKFCRNQLNQSSDKFKETSQTYFDKLKNIGFNSPEAHQNAFRDEEQVQQITEQINEYTKKTQQLDIEIMGLRTQFEDTPFDPDVLGQITTVAEEIAAEIQGAREAIGRQNEKIDNLKDNFQKRKALDNEVQDAKQEWERWQRLKDTIRANALRDFALDIMFKQVSRIANVQLAYLTSDRYQLKVESIGDLTVVDRWNANEERPVETLSGGESFLTSLALALALSELSQGRAQLNSLFLDEGFGTLDAETLDIAIASLEGLRMQGRSIYLISHIHELTRRLPVKIKVRKRGDGSSYIDRN